MLGLRRRLDCCGFGLAGKSSCNVAAFLSPCFCVGVPWNVQRCVVVNQGEDELPHHGVGLNLPECAKLVSFRSSSRFVFLVVNVAINCLENELPECAVREIQNVTTSHAEVLLKDLPLCHPEGTHAASVSSCT